MTHHWDDFSKSLADESVPRRESLRRLGFLFAGAVLSPLGVGNAWAGTDRCKTFCRCRNASQQNDCLATCRACNSDTKRLAGSCGNYTCCGAGLTSCRRYCADLGNDWYNCGACGHGCYVANPYESSACIDGQCEYGCVEGAVRCDGICTPLDSDPYNCGACGVVCPSSAPYCNQGECSVCAPGLTFCTDPYSGSVYCADLMWDGQNCGACGYVCNTSFGETCWEGACTRFPDGWGTVDPWFQP